MNAHAVTNTALLIRTLLFFEDQTVVQLILFHSFLLYAIVLLCVYLVT